MTLYRKSPILFILETIPNISDLSLDIISVEFTRASRRDWGEFGKEVAL